MPKSSTARSTKPPKVRERKLGRHHAIGLCHPDGLIEIDERLRGKARLDILIHEYLHHIHPTATEAYVDHTASKLAEFLWSQRVRIIDSA